MANQTMSDGELLRQLNAHPDVRNRIESILSVVSDESGDLRRADAHSSLEMQPSLRLIPRWTSTVNLFSPPQGQEGPEVRSFTLGKIRLEQIHRGWTRLYVAPHTKTRYTYRLSGCIHAQIEFVSAEIRAWR